MTFCSAFSEHRQFVGRQRQYSPDPQNPDATDANTAPVRRLYFLQHFVPFLRQRLAQRLIVDTLSGFAGLTNDMTRLLLSDVLKAGTAEAFGKLHKAAAILINGFALSTDEVNYWQNHTAAFDGFDFNSVSLQHWKGLWAYTDLRNSLQRAETRLIDVFDWAGRPDDATQLGQKIAAVTGWKRDNVDKLLAPDHFDLNRPKAFRNEANLALLRKAVVVADKLAVDIDRLFEWAKPTSEFNAYRDIAAGIHNAARARFDQQDRERVVKPFNDQLRENQKQALIAYLLVQQDLIDWGVVDADSLFEFFLIDVQMDACMQTSRIEQAISSVQLFIQRCLLGLEEKQVNGTEVGVPIDAIDRVRWEWMRLRKSRMYYSLKWVSTTVRRQR